MNPYEQGLCALRKAGILCEQVLADAPLITIRLRRAAHPSPFVSRENLRRLKLAGLFIPCARCLWTEGETGEPGREDGRDDVYLSVAFELPKSSLQYAAAPRLQRVFDPHAARHYRFPL